ncbi:MAG: hypothetical protein JNK05_13355 [Myxococcales bacterium]|nr:hypothetical protein [Myxococcales bacterium]
MTAPLPDLDAPCGDGFVYRDLIECGETWHRLVAHDDGNAAEQYIPVELNTYEAIEDLCSTILVPVRREFGSLVLTYGFASRALTRAIPRGIAPSLDQHAGHELSSGGKPRCARLGLAVDFRVEGVDLFRVAAWIAEHCAFDRLYVYGPDRPLHVSVAPRADRAPGRQIVRVDVAPSGRRIPRRLSLADLLRAAPSGA